MRRRRRPRCELARSPHRKRGLASGVEISFRVGLDQNLGLKPQTSENDGTNQVEKERKQKTSRYQGV